VSAIQDFLQGSSFLDGLISNSNGIMGVGTEEFVAHCHWALYWMHLALNSGIGDPE
jgi:hypothetical protein